jgi:hypothetical protein
VGIVLALDEPAALAWGPKSIVLYNDAYVERYGDKITSRPWAWVSRLPGRKSGAQLDLITSRFCAVAGWCDKRTGLFRSFATGELRIFTGTNSFNPVLDADAAHGVGGVFIVAEQLVQTTAVMRSSAHGSYSCQVLVMPCDRAMTSL